MESDIENFAREGIPTGERSEIYKKYLELEGKEKYYE